MKQPRDIDYHNLMKKIAADPGKQVSDHLPDKQMFTILEFLLLEKHVRECIECMKLHAQVVASAPKGKLEDRIKNEN